MPSTSSWSGRALSRHLAVLGCGLVLMLCAAARGSAQTTPAGVASLIIDLGSGQVRASERADVIERAVLPGSVMKVAAVAAALESGLITDGSTIVCTRRIVVDGHQLTCTHPDLHRPLRASEALAHSCNVYVATMAARLPRAALDRALASLGLPPSSATASVRASALGLDGTRMTPRALVQAIARVGSAGGPQGWQASTLATVRQGLVRAATVGTAAAIGQAGIDALAKTGTVDAGGISQGLVVGVTPSTNPTVGFALLASGGAGRDAAALIAERLAQRGVGAARSDGGTGQVATGGAGATVRVGVTQADGRTIVKPMAIDDYVAGVVAGETATGASAAALEALAIAVRTYAVANRGRHARDGFDLCDLTHCQVLRPATASTRRAATATTGTVLTREGRPAEVFYTASCGGHTAKPSEVWRGASDASFLPSQVDEACAHEPGWSAEIPARDLLRALRAGGFSGEAILAVRVTRRTASNRVAWLHVDGVTPSEVSGEDLRTLVGRTLGWQHLRSTLFEVSRTGAGYRFAGRGAGHGVGLCVAGAAARARAGATRDEILRAYFPGLDVRPLPDGTEVPRVRVVLPAADESSRPSLQHLVDAAAATVAERLGAPIPSGVVLRFHPTVESYQRTTGRQWFTAGSTRGTQVDLLPLGVLRTRGLLDATLRHELAHALTATSLAGQPLWMREGAAMWTESRGGPTGLEPQRQAGAATVPCPADEEFARAASADALRRLYARALTCYEVARSKGGQGR